MEPNLRAQGFEPNLCVARASHPDHYKVKKVAEFAKIMKIEHRRVKKTILCSKLKELYNRQANRNVVRRINFNNNRQTNNQSNRNVVRRINFNNNRQANNQANRNVFNPDLCSAGRKGYNMQMLKMFAKAYSIVATGLKKQQLCAKLKAAYAQNGPKTIKNIRMNLESNATNKKNFAFFIDLLNKDPRFKYASSVYTKVFKSTNKVMEFATKIAAGFFPPNLHLQPYARRLKKQRKLKFLKMMKAKVTTLMGHCHINTTLNQYFNLEPALFSEKVMEHIRSLKNQMLMAINLFVVQLNNLKTNLEKNVYITKVLDKLDDNLGGRPCLENAIDALTNTMTETAFEWKGKNKLIIWNTAEGKADYKNRVIGSAVGSYTQSFNANNQRVFNSKNHLNKVEMMYNKFKYLPVYLVRNDQNVPRFWNVKNIPNNNNVTLNAINEYVGYL